MKTPQDLIQSLRDHNKWRNGADTQPTCPHQLTLDLDQACRLLEGYIKEIEAWKQRERESADPLDLSPGCPELS